MEASCQKDWSQEQVLWGVGESGPEVSTVLSPGLRWEQGGAGPGDASTQTALSSENIGTSVEAMWCTHTLTTCEWKLQVSAWEETVH